MGITIHAGIGFLRVQNPPWRPVAAEKKLAVYFSECEKHGQDSVAAKVALGRFHEALDAVLEAFRQSIWERVDRAILKDLQKVGSASTPRIRKLREAAEEAGRFMSRPPRPLGWPTWSPPAPGNAGASPGHEDAPIESDSRIRGVVAG